MRERRQHKQPSLRLQQQGPADYQTLSLAAADLVGVAGEQIVGQAHLPEGGLDLLHTRFFTFPQMVDGHGLQQAVPDTHGRVQGRLRVLKDDLHPPVVGFALPAVKAGDILAFKPDRPAGGPEDPGDHAGQGGLAAAAVAHQAKGPAPLQGKADAIHRPGGVGAEDTAGEISADCVQFQYLIHKESTSLSRLWAAGSPLVFLCRTVPWLWDNGGRKGSRCGTGG